MSSPRSTCWSARSRKIYFYPWKIKVSILAGPAGQSTLLYKCQEYCLGAMLSAAGVGQIISRSTSTELCFMAQIVRCWAILCITDISMFCLRGVERWQKKGTSPPGTVSWTALLYSCQTLLSTSYLGSWQVVMQLFSSYVLRVLSWGVSSEQWSAVVRRICKAAPSSSRDGRWVLQLQWPYSVRGNSAVRAKLQWYPLMEAQYYTHYHSPSPDTEPGEGQQVGGVLEWLE